MVKSNLLHKLSFFFLLFLAPITLQAAEKIANVDIVGLTHVTETDMRRFIQSIEGTEYSPDRVNGDVKRLYETGLFKDVRVEKEGQGGGLKLVFYVVEKGTIGKITINGNKKIKDKNILDVISARKGAPIDEQRITESIQAIKRLYEDKSQEFTEITYHLVPMDGPGNNDELVFDISEITKARIKRISFVGNKVFSDKKLAQVMKTKVKGLFSFVSSSGKLKDEKLEADRDLLKEFYLNEGFVKVNISEPQISLSRDRESIYISIPVTEGIKYKIGKVDIVGDILTTKEELVSKLKTKAGDVFNQSNLTEDERNLSQLYGDQSYAYANIYPQIDTHDDQAVADVVINIQKGRKIYVERIEIKGNTITRDKVIRRELAILEGAPFTTSGLAQSYRRLYQLGYFENINIATPRGSRDDLMVVVVEVKEKPTGTFSIGGGFSSLESFIFTASVQKDNFFGYGLRGGLSANISKLRQEFTFNLTDRYFLDTRWIFSTSIYRYSSALNRDFDQRSFGGDVSFGREIFEHLDVSLGYGLEDVSVTDFSSQVPLFFQRNASGLTSRLSSTLAFDTRDNRLLTSKGMYHAVTTEWAGHGIGGDNDFLKLSAETRFFFKFPLKSVLKVRGVFSYVNSLNDEAVPLFERFFLGGINTLRGYDLNTIGPQITIPSSPTGNDSAFTYGGNRRLLSNIEYEFPIYDPAGLRFVAFLDAGQSYAETESISLDRLRTDYGFGVRWNSPFGPLRFEWGFPIDKRAGESSTVFNFTIGQSF